MAFENVQMKACFLGTAVGRLPTFLTKKPPQAFDRVGIKATHFGSGGRRSPHIQSITSSLTRQQWVFIGGSRTTGTLASASHRRRRLLRRNLQNCPSKPPVNRTLLN